MFNTLNTDIIIYNPPLWFVNQPLCNSWQNLRRFLCKNVCCCCSKFKLDSLWHRESVLINVSVTFGLCIALTQKKIIPGNWEKDVREKRREEKGSGETARRTNPTISPVFFLYIVFFLFFNFLILSQDMFHCEWNKVYKGMLVNQMICD